MTRRCAVRQAILWPGYLIYLTVGAESVRRISDFFGIAANRQPVGSLSDALAQWSCRHIAVHVTLAQLRVQQDNDWLSHCRSALGLVFTLNLLLTPAFNERSGCGPPCWARQQRWHSRFCSRAPQGCQAAQQAPLGLHRQVSRPDRMQQRSHQHCQLRKPAATKGNVAVASDTTTHRPYDRQAAITS